MLLALPENGPCVWTLLFSVLTLLVTPGIAAWLAVTEPVCTVLPESGNWFATGVCVCTFGPDNCASARPSDKIKIAETGTICTRNLCFTEYRFLSELFAKT